MCERGWEFVFLFMFCGRYITLPSAPFLMRGRAFSTIKDCVAAISACYVGLKTGTVGEHTLMRCFMQGVLRTRPMDKNVAPKWDLSMVLDALTQALFELIDRIDTKYCLMRWLSSLLWLLQSE